MDIQSYTCITDKGPLLQINEDTWSDVKNELINVLSRLMRQEIRPDSVENIRVQLANQVSSRFNLRERNLIVDMLNELVLANTFVNQDATDTAREAAANAVACRPSSKSASSPDPAPSLPSFQCFFHPCLVPFIMVWV